MTFENTESKQIVVNYRCLPRISARFPRWYPRAAARNGGLFRMPKCNRSSWISCALLALVACNSTPKATGPEREKAMPSFRTFEDDVAFLARFGPIKVLESPAGG